MEEDTELHLKILSAESSEWQSRMDPRDPARLVATVPVLWR
jgi:hypothetical protein